MKDGQMVVLLTDFKIQIEDPADECDANINGVVRFEIPNINNCPEEIVECIYEIIKKLQDNYRNILKDFNVDFCFLDVSFEDGWLDFSIEGKDEEEAAVEWKAIQGVGGCPDNSP